MSLIHLRVINNDDATPGELDELEQARPKVRADCVDELEDRMSGKTVCPFVSCKYNTFLTINRDGSLSTAADDVTEMKVSNCVLDYAQTGGVESFEKISEAFGVSKQAIFKTFDIAMLKSKRRYGSDFSAFEFPQHRESNLASAQEQGTDYVSWISEGMNSRK